MIQGIVTGIGFLGAGVIVKEGFTVRGLTTAASIWVASAIGVVIGAGSYLTGAEAAWSRWSRSRCCGTWRIGYPRSRTCTWTLPSIDRSQWTRTGSGN